jgi:YD repeat-containing protein
LVDGRPADETSADTSEIAEGVTVDYDAAGRVIGIDIEHAAALIHRDESVGVSHPVARSSSITSAGRSDDTTCHTRSKSVPM